MGEQPDKGLKAADGALRRYPADPEALGERERLQAIEARAVAAQRNKKAEVYTPWRFDAAEARRRQEEAAKVAGCRREWSLDLPNGEKLELVLIPAGAFTMGSNDGDSDEKRPHEVTITKPFYIGMTEVTQAQWRSVMENNDPSWFSSSAGGKDEVSGVDTSKHPAECLRWQECRIFCDKLTALLQERTETRGLTIRLPSEAEWEYACRAGTATPFAFGATITTNQANYNGNYPHENGPKGVFRQKTTPVGSFPANAWGLHDMHGNVWEWCEDVWHSNYDGAPADGSPWVSDGDVNCHVLRGGSWGGKGRSVRSASRGRGDAAYHWSGTGFRVVGSVSAAGTL